MKTIEAKELIKSLVERVDKVGERDFLDKKINDKTLIADIFKTYKQIFNKYWKESCASCYFDCYAYLYGLLKNDKDLVFIENKLYDIRPGALLMGFPKGGSEKNCTNNNITNELAEWHLKNNPGVEKYFTRMPADWRERCQRAVEVVETPEVPEVKKEAVTFDIKGKSYKEYKAIARQMQKDGLIPKTIIIDHTKQVDLIKLINENSRD